MILETQQERDAFKFIYDIASESTSRSGCNDLTNEERDKFKGLEVETTDTDGTKFMRPVTYDFDVLFWLENQVKK
jgi:hypothetical protein